jgi:hypothetical protein
MVDARLADPKNFAHGQCIRGSASPPPGCSTAPVVDSTYRRRRQQLRLADDGHRHLFPHPVVQEAHGDLIEWHWPADGSTALIGIVLDHVVAAAFGMHADQRREGDAMKTHAFWTGVG